MSLTRLNSLWVGDRLGYLERLCLASARAVGHDFTLYSYTPDSLAGVPEGIELRDAREIMPEDRLVRYSDTGSIQLGANFFRYELMAKDVGYWVDMDFCFLQPLDFDSPYVFGWEYEGWINNALLLLPPTSDMTNDLREIPKTNRRPPWFGPMRSTRYYWDRLTKGDIRVQYLPWGTYSSGLVTYAAKKHSVVDRAQHASVFYPVRWKDARTLFDSSEIVEEMIKPETRAVHMWYSQLVDLMKSPPPKGSFLEKVCSRFDVDTSSSGG